MDDLALAEQYYAVARHLESNARGMLSTVEYLNSVADKLCEENMRKLAPRTESTQKFGPCPVCGGGTHHKPDCAVLTDSRHSAPEQTSGK